MPKTVLFFDHTAKLGGGEIALLNLVKQINKAEYFPVVVLASDGPLRVGLEAAGIETHILPLAESVIETRKDTLRVGSAARVMTAWHVLSYCWRLAHFIRERGIEVIHTNSLKADILGGISARLTGVPCVWHVRDRIQNDYLPTVAVHAFRWLSRILPSFVIANSAATMATLRLPEHWAIVVPSRAVVHDGVEEDVRPDERKTQSALVGLVGRITRWKGQHIFIKAAAQLHDRFPDARFQIIGSAMFDEHDYERQLRDSVAARGLTGCIEFTGFRADVRDLIQNLSVLVHASITGEPFGQVIIEGMAAGVPVVATRGGGVPEIVVDAKTGLLVPMGDADAMAAAIASLLSDPARAKRMGAAGRDRVKERFTVAHTARKVEAVLSQFGSRSGRRAA